MAFANQKQPSQRTWSCLTQKNGKVYDRVVSYHEDKSKEQALRCLGDAVKMDTGESF